MDPLLRERIALLRDALNDSEDPSIGFIAPPSEQAAFPVEVPVPYQQFLREADGLACGVILLYESDGLLALQAPAKSLPGGRARWFCIGSLDESRLFLDTLMNAVHRVHPDEKFDPDDALGDLNYFLLTCVFGKGYEEFVSDPSDDPWFSLLQDVLPEEEML